MARSLTFVIDGEVDTKITVTELDNGSLQFDLQVLGTGSIGDLRALFFDLEGFDTDTDGLLAKSTAQYSGDITDQSYEEAGVDTLGQDANIKGQVSNELGDFDVGIEFGTSGMAGDDIQETSFVLSYEYGDLNLNMVDLSDFGIRYTSVGDWDGSARTGSVKAGTSAGGVADNDGLAVNENETASVGVLLNDTNGATNIVTGVFDENGNAFDLTASGFEKTIIVGGLDFGNLAISADGTATFDANGSDVDALALGETITRVFGYETRAMDGSLAAAYLTITINGQNDSPTLAAGLINATEDGLPARVDLAALGDDVDGDDDANSLSYMITGAPLEGAATIIGTTLNFDPARDFQDLAAGVTRDVVIQVTATDSHGATVVNDVTVTVTGTNDGPRFTRAQTARLTEANSPLTLSATASLEFLDVDTSDRPTVSVDFLNAGWSRGPNTLSAAQVSALATELVLNPDPGNTNSGQVSYTYSVDASVLDFIAEGERVFLTYRATVTDYSGATDTTVATVSITGSNDAPIISTATTSPGDLDIVWGRLSNLGNSISLNDWSAGFSDGVNLAAQARWNDVSLGDLDGDGDLDIVGTRSSSMNDILLNDGSGNFTSNGQINLAVGANMASVLARIIHQTPGISFRHAGSAGLTAEF